MCSETVSNAPRQRRGSAIVGQVVEHEARVGTHRASVGSRLEVVGQLGAAAPVDYNDVGVLHSEESVLHGAQPGRFAVTVPTMNQKDRSTSAVEN